MWEQRKGTLTLTLMMSCECLALHCIALHRVMVNFAYTLSVGWSALTMMVTCGCLQLTCIACAGPTLSA